MDDTPAYAPPSGTSAASPARPWVGVLSWTAFWLAVVAGLQVFLAILAGLTVKADARLGTAYKIGASFLEVLDAVPIGLMLVLSVVLVVVPVVAGVAISGRDERVTSSTLGMVAGLSFLLFIFSILAALTGLEIRDLKGQPVTAAVRWVLLSFVVRNAGTAVIAFAASLILIRSRLDLGPVPATRAEPEPPDSSSR